MYDGRTNLFSSRTPDPMRHRLPHVPLRLLALLAVAGCGGTAPIEPTERTPTAISITPDNIIMTFLDQSLVVTARVVDQNDIVMPTTIEWVVADPSIASISVDGRITALAVGSTTLTASGLGLSATASVEVVQQVSTFSVIQGDNQEAIRDSTLADPIVVRVADQGGTGIPGLAVTFSPAANNGTVSVTSVDTDENGDASTEWTLGSLFGEQELLVAIPGQSVTVNSIARSEVPTPDLAVVGVLRVSNVVPTSLESLSVFGSIKNLGDLASPPSRVSLTANGNEVGTLDLPSLAPSDSTEVQFDVGPLDSGSNSLVFTVDADDDVVELFESNNELSNSLTVLNQASVTAGVPVTNVSVGADGEALFRVDVAGPTTLTVSFTAPNGDADIYVADDPRPGFREDFKGCVSLSPDSNESCQIPFAEGTYHIAVHAFTSETQGGAISGGTLSVTTGDALESFDIELDFIDPGTDSQNDAFVAAAAKWSQVIVADIWDVEFSPTNALNNTSCLGQPYDRDTPVDDVLILVVIEPIDGQGNVLGQAGPCITRPVNGHTVIGTMTFDEADLIELENGGQLSDVILHEMGHVLGVGTLWGFQDLLRNPSIPANAGADTHFAGPNAIAAFDNVGGLGFVGSKVPVANDSIRGQSDAHWRESVFDSELMTPFIEGTGTNPMSEVTVASMRDLGYGIDLNAADNFFVPLTSAQVNAPTAPGLPGFIDLRGDVREGPIYVVDKAGRLREVLR